MAEKFQSNKICKRGIWDITVPGITFNEKGISNYAEMFDKLCKAYPRGNVGKKDWENIVNKIKTAGKGRKYDCIIGVSGGTDSSYLLHLVKTEYGLRPLAVNLDNGWNSDIAVKNIKKMTTALDIDLETYVIDYEEIKDLLRCYMYASLPWIDIPTDLAIKAVLFKLAHREKIKFILRANDFRSEGTQPREWSYGDGKQLLFLHKKFGKVSLKTFPNYTFANLLYYAIVFKIKNYYPYYYLDYQKNDAKRFLIENYNWEYYGGHHHENHFTKFAIANWLPTKFNIDKRIITLSAQILSGEISRDYAIEMISKPPYDPEQMVLDLDFVLKKLDFNKTDYEILLKNDAKFFYDYPSYYPFMQKFSRLSNFVIKMLYPYKPMSVFQKELRDSALSPQKKSNVHQG